jgi:hypothetical protein
VRALLFAVAVALLVSPALAAASRSDAERARHGTRQLGVLSTSIFCPHPTVSRPRSQRRQHAARISLRGAPSLKRRGEARAGRKVLAQLTYAVQFKAGLSKAERDAAFATLRDKYKLKIVKFNKGLDILRVAPRVAPRRAPKSLGAALAPKVIQDLRQEPFVDAAYVDFPVSPPRPAARRSRSAPVPGN